ncbi:MAG: HAMP domain-containing protein [Anaerolineae bacterium]|nr:HAMP domain-containing protein [Anaerolineae bacterium]
MRLTRLWAPFRGLRWKLTFSYTLVTVAVVLALEAVTLCGVGVYFGRPSFWMHELEKASVRVSEEIRPFLEASPPDYVGLEAWFQNALPAESIQAVVLNVEAEAATESDENEMFLSLSEGDCAAILGSAGETLVCSAPLASTGSRQKEMFVDPLASEESVALVRAALRGEPAIRRVSGGTILAVQPVVGEGDVVLGVLYLRFVSFAALPLSFLSSSLQILGGSLLFFTVAAGIIGTVFGLVTARGFVRRLKELDNVTEAWGRGDFTAKVHDASPDEIGELARRLSLMAEQIQNLVQVRQELAALEERNRLARDLHDSVKQQVFATTMMLGTAETLWERNPGAARQKVGEALVLSRQAQQELTGLIHELRPVPLEGKSLVAALREHVQERARQVGIEARITVTGHQAMPIVLEQALFRVAQEALANVVKHSRAQHVEIALNCGAEAIVLQVADDGRGFDPASASAGMGLRSMRERIKALGGELIVESAPGAGTRIFARCAPEGTPGK